MCSNIFSSNFEYCYTIIRLLYYYTLVIIDIKTFSLLNQYLYVECFDRTFFISTTICNNNLIYRRMQFSNIRYHLRNIVISSIRRKYLLQMPESDCTASISFCSPSMYNNMFSSLEMLRRCIARLQSGQRAFLFCNSV